MAGTPAARKPAPPAARKPASGSASRSAPPRKAGSRAATRDARPTTKRDATQPATRGATQTTKRGARQPASRDPAKARRKPARGSGPFAAAEAQLRAHALAKPEATEHFPWGERAIKVNGKVFLFMYADATRLSLSTKLPSSSGVALMLPFASPTGYGLGKAGWVSAGFEGTEQPPVELLCAWIDESYQAVAPARLARAAAGTRSERPRS
ncbi:MAG TPA: MmcQ/YjbR family DNA-binding protein [Kofleriaceae bacterium]|nr:MmcQ/YjbR family DNA-binding protein [Kofleriaceae bacterium]